VNIAPWIETSGHRTGAHRQRIAGHRPRVGWYRQA